VVKTGKIVLTQNGTVFEIAAKTLAEKKKTERMPKEGAAFMARFILKESFASNYSFLRPSLDVVLL